MATDTRKSQAAAKRARATSTPKAAATAARPAAKVARASTAKPAAAAPAPKAPATRPAGAAKPAAKAVKVAKAEKAEKPRKPKMVRDSFTIPKAEYAVIDTLKQRAAKAGSPAKKSELLRAGIKALEAMGDTAFLAALKAVPAIKTGRPAKA